MELKPQEAARKLMENVGEFRQLAEKIIEARSNDLIAQKKFKKNKARSYVNRKAEMSNSAAEQMVKVDTVDDDIEALTTDYALKDALLNLNIAIEGNNSYKMAIKLMEMEVKNLNLQ